MVQAPLFAVLYQFPCCLAERGAQRANLSLHHKPKLSVLLGQSLQKYAKIRITNDKAAAKSYFGGLFLITFCLIYFGLCLWLSFLRNELGGAAKFGW